MLAQTVRKNITTKKNMDIRTKATRFSDLFQARPKSEEVSFDELLDSKISEYVKQEEVDAPIVVEQDIDIEFESEEARTYKPDA